MTRRTLLRDGGLVLFGTSAAPLWLRRAASAAEGGPKKVLVAIFQRGAMDGLNAVVPFGDPAYAGLRPNIAISEPSRGSENAAIDLDGFFGLHPALAPLKALYDARQLAVIHAVGSPDPTRSHFDAQDYMESGTPGRKATSDGWLNRSLVESGNPSPLRAVSLGSALARTLRGPNAAVAMKGVEEFQARDAMFEQLYGNSNDGLLKSTGHDTFEALKLIGTIRRQPYTPANGAAYPNGALGQNLLQIARLIKADVGLEVAFADMGGWDTHANQPAQLQDLLSQFAGALAAFHQDLGSRMRDVTVVTMSEFGRTAKENGARGTDHGHANVMFALGGAINGGKVYGEWPGLEREQLYEQRDLAMTTDFRDVLGELVTRRLGGVPLSRVFPGYSAPRFRGIVAA